MKLLLSLFTTGILTVLLTLSVPEKSKNTIFEIPIIPQTLNAIAKSINLHIIRKLIKYSLKKDFLKAMFTLSDFEILLFEARSIPWPAQLVTGSRRVKISVKNQRNVRLLLELLEKSLPYRLRRFWMVFIFLIYFNPFSSRKIEKHNFWDSSNSTNFKHQ